MWILIVDFPISPTKDARPHELRAWVGRLRAYFKETGATAADLVSQQQYFWSFVDLHLQGLVEAEGVDDGTEVFGDDGLVAKLEKVYEHLYPIFTRRLQFFQAVQQQGESFSDFTTRLRATSEGADLGALTRNDLFCFRYLVACTDAKLRDRLLKLENPDLDKMNKEIMAYEIQSASAKAIDKAGGKMFTNYANKVTKSQYKKNKFFCMFCSKKGHTEDYCRNKKKSDNFNRENRGPRGSDHGRRKGMRHEFSEDSSSDSGTSANSSPERPKSKSDRIAACKALSEVYPQKRAAPKILVCATKEKTGQSFSIKATADTGCEKTVVAENLLRQTGIKCKAPRDSLIAANGKYMKSDGSIKLTITPFRGLEVSVDCVVSSSVRDTILLSYFDLKRMGFLKNGFGDQSGSESDSSSMSNRMPRVRVMSLVKRARMQPHNWWRRPNSNGFNHMPSFDAWCKKRQCIARMVAD